MLGHILSLNDVIFEENRDVFLFSLRNMLLVNFCSMNTCVVTCIIIDTGNIDEE